MEEEKNPSNPEEYRINPEEYELNPEDYKIHLEKKNNGKYKPSIWNKIAGWGSKNVYKNSICLLVSIFLPIVGTLFLLNQYMIRQRLYRKGFVFKLSLFIGFLWWIAIIILGIYAEVI